MKKLILMIGLLVIASFSVQAAGKYPSCKAGFDAKEMFRGIKKDPTIKYQMSQGYHTQKLWRPGEGGVQNVVTKTNYCTARGNLVKPGNKVEQVLKVNYTVRYHADGSVETKFQNVTIVGKRIPKSKR